MIIFRRKFLIMFSFVCVFSLIASRNIIRVKGFHPYKILSRYPHEPKWTQDNFNYADNIFSQPYSYLSSGKNCYAFISQDKQYVIKFFKQTHFKSPTFRSQLFSSFQYAFNELKEETGIIHLHLTKTKNLHTLLTLFDEKKKKIILSLDEMEFLVQKASTPVFSTITEYMDEEREDLAKNSISNIVSLIKSRCEKGFIDQDVNCERNIGLIDTKAIEIDVGEFKKANQKIDTFMQIQDATKDLLEWLDGKYPALHKHLKNISLENR